jgi:TfoX/Sxy family transcriptional regulator of competence genes
MTIDNATLKEIQKKMESLISKWKGIDTTVMFGKPSFLVNDSLFALLTNDGIVLKLNQDDRNQAMNIDGAHYFTVRPGIPAKELVEIPAESPEALGELLPLIKSACRYARSKSK